MAGLYRFAAGLALLAIGTSAAAQSAFTSAQYSSAQSAPRDNRLQIGIVIPFGHAGTSAERAPRLEAWSEAGRLRDASVLRTRAERELAYGRSAHLGLTLNQQPRLMLNGREVPHQSNRHGVSTLGAAGIVLGVVVIGLGLGVLGVFGRTE